MSVVGIDFGSLHSKACYPPLTPLLPLPDALRVNFRSVLQDTEASISLRMRSRIVQHREFSRATHFMLG